MLEVLNKHYHDLQLQYGDPNLDSITNGGCISTPDICFVFMNPTKRNIASDKSWKGLKSPWIGTKNIWGLFNKVNLLDNDIYTKIQNMKPTDWDYDFAKDVYDRVSDKKLFITNLGKCTQSDAKPLNNSIFYQYLDFLYQEINIIKPKIIITFGNQVSSIFLNKKISVSQCRKQYFDITINNEVYKVFPVYYPVGNGIFNIDKSIEDIKWIIDNFVY